MEYLISSSHGAGSGRSHGVVDSVCIEYHKSDLIYKIPGRVKSTHIIRI